MCLSVCTVSEVCVYMRVRVCICAMGVVCVFVYYSKCRVFDVFSFNITLE